MKETKESVYREFARYENEINEIMGHPPVHTEDSIQTWLHKYSRRMSLQDIRHLRECILGYLEELRREVAQKARIAAFKETEEGRKFYKVHEDMKNGLSDACSRQRIKAQNDISDMLRPILGDWDVMLSFGRRYAEIKVWDQFDARETFGSSFWITLEHTSDGLQYTINIGRTGSFDVLGDAAGSRALFYTKVGALLADKDRLQMLKEKLLKAIESMNKIRSRIDEENKLLENPFRDEM